MKSKLKRFVLDALQSIISGALVFTIISLLYLSLDELNSLCVGLKTSLINEIPVSPILYAGMWVGIILAVKFLFLLNSVSINKEVSRKRINQFWILLAILVILLHQGHDLAFSAKWHVKLSVIFKLPVKRWLLAVFAIVWIIAFAAASSIFHEIIYVKELQETHDFLKEEDEKEEDQ